MKLTPADTGTIWAKANIMAELSRKHRFIIVNALLRIMPTVPEKKRVSAFPKNKQQQQIPATGDFTIADYSEKSIAVFGDTKSIKKQLAELGGRFNKYLTQNAQKSAVWVFSKSKEQ